MSYPILVERLEAYTEQDAKDLGVLRNAMSSRRSPGKLTEQRVRSMVDHDDRVLVVARFLETGNIIGCETLVTIPLPEAEDEDPDGFAWLGFVSTHDEHRGHGIVKHVALEGLRWCVEQGIKEVKFTSNSHNDERANARGFYDKFGAVVVAKGVGPEDTDLWSWNVDVGIDKLIAGTQH